MLKQKCTGLVLNLFALLLATTLSLSITTNAFAAGTGSKTITTKSTQTVQVKTASEADKAFAKALSSLQSPVTFKSTEGLNLIKTLDAYIEKTPDININGYECEYAGNTYTFTFLYYDSEFVLGALKKGSPDGLTDKGKYIYKEVSRIIPEIIGEDMTDYEKAKAVHDYLVLNTAYDEENFRKATIPPESYTAYGLFKNGVAVCQGYTEAFKLMMNYLGVETMAVSGTADGIDHIWNKIKLDGEYYNIDVTMDDPAPDREGQISYAYFNVTDKMLSNDHIWPTDAYPSAQATDYYYYNYEVKASSAATVDQLTDILTASLKDRQTELTVLLGFEGTSNGLSGAMKKAAKSLNLGLSYNCSVSGNVATFTVEYQ